MPAAAPNFPLDELTASLIEHGMERDFAAEALGYMRPAIELDRPDLFTSYVRWRGDRDSARSARVEMVRSLAYFHEIESQVPATWRSAWAAAVDAALSAFSAGPRPTPVEEFRTGPHRALAAAYLDALTLGNRREAVRMIDAELDDGLTIRELYLDVFQPTLAEVGRLWETRQLTVGHEHYCTAVTLSIMAQLYPRIFGTKRNGRRLVATSVEDNLHEVGIRMLSDLFELEGWDTYCMGASTPVESIVSAIVERKAEVLALSVMLSSQLSAASETIEALRKVPELADVKILVGGRAFANSPDLSKHIGADGWAPDATAALEIADQLTRGRRS